LVWGCCGRGSQQRKNEMPDGFQRKGLGLHDEGSLLPCCRDLIKVIIAGD
jgi:hypothetical protein